MRVRDLLALNSALREDRSRLEEELSKTNAENRSLTEKLRVAADELPSQGAATGSEIPSITAEEIEVRRGLTRTIAP